MADDRMERAIALAREAHAAQQTMMERLETALDTAQTTAMQANERLQVAEDQLAIVRGDRDRLLRNIARLTGIDPDLLAPSGVALDEELDGWLQRRLADERDRARRAESEVAIYRDLVTRFIWACENLGVRPSPVFGDARRVLGDADPLRFHEE